MDRSWWKFENTDINIRVDLSMAPGATGSEWVTMVTACLCPPPRSLQLWHSRPVSMVTSELLPLPPPIPKATDEKALVQVYVCVWEREWVIHWDDSSYLCEKSVTTSALASWYKAVIFVFPTKNSSPKNLCVYKLGCTHAPASHPHRWSIRHCACLFFRQKHVHRMRIHVST